VTFYETTGWKGVMERQAGSRAPDRFRSRPGSVYPLYHVLADVGEFAGAEVIPISGFNRSAIAALWLRQGSRDRLLIANLTLEPQTVTVSGWNGPAQVRHLDETNAGAAMTEPTAFRLSGQEVGIVSQLELLPYGVLRVDRG
jgi:hypothetical protein